MPSDEEGKEQWDKNGFLAGDEVVACGRDYRFTGYVVAVFWTLRGKKKYVVENADRIFDIFSKHELVKINDNPDPGLSVESERVKREAEDKKGMSNRFWQGVIVGLIVVLPIWMVVLWRWFG